MLRICQAPRAKRSIQSLSKSVSVPTHGRQESAANFKDNKTDENERQCTTSCIKAIAGEVVKSTSVHLRNLGDGRQVIALKSATALILDRQTVSKLNNSVENLPT